MSYLQTREQYEERYDKVTVELCREREEMAHKLLGERPPLDSEGNAETGYYQYSVLYFGFVESLAGERRQDREETIRGWMAKDEEKDRRLADAKPATIPYCRSCGGDMQITLRSYLHRDRPGGKTDDDILFMFDCKPCHKRVAAWQDGTEWKPRQACCEQCGVPVDETDRRRGNVITYTYTCGNCGHRHKSTLKLGVEAKAEPDPHFKLDRRRFCFDAATGKKYLERKAHLEHIGKLLEEGRQQAAGGGVALDPVAEAVKETKRLKIAQVADLLRETVATAGYTEFKLGEPQLGPEVAVPFSCLDNKPERGDYDSRMSLKKLITGTLADTNWQLMSDGIHHRVGYLNGRLRAYESDEELHKLAQKQFKAGTRKPVATKPAPATEAPAPAEPAPAQKRPQRGKQRAIRVRGVLHPNLHILIPPREPTKPPPKTGKKK